MKRCILVLPLILILGVLNIYAQKLEEGGVWKSSGVATDSSSKPLAQMPIYNPRNIDAKLLIWEPEGLIDNMPIIGQKKNLPSKILFPNLAEDLFQQGPGRVNKEKKADAAEQE